MRSERKGFEWHVSFAVRLFKRIQKFIVWLVDVAANPFRLFHSLIFFFILFPTFVFFLVYFLLRRQHSFFLILSGGCRRTLPKRTEIGVKVRTHAVCVRATKNHVDDERECAPMVKFL